MTKVTIMIGEWLHYWWLRKINK